MYLITTDANVVRVAVGAIAFRAVVPKNFAVAAEPAAGFNVYPRRTLHECDHTPISIDNPRSSLVKPKKH